MFFQRNNGKFHNMEVNFYCDVMEDLLLSAGVFVQDQGGLQQNGVPQCGGTGEGCDYLIRWKPCSRRCPQREDLGTPIPPAALLRPHRSCPPPLEHTKRLLCLKHLVCVCLGGRGGGVGCFKMQGITSKCWESVSLQQSSRLSGGVSVVVSVSAPGCETSTNIRVRMAAAAMAASCGWLWPAAAACRILEMCNSLCPGSPCGKEPMEKNENDNESEDDIDNRIGIRLRRRIKTEVITEI
jgi:hypothetical protein